MRLFALVVGSIVLGCTASPPIPHRQKPASVKRSPVDMARARHALRERDLDQARDIAEAALAQNTDVAEAHYVLGACDEMEGKRRAAIVHYREALTSDPILLAASIHLATLLVEAKEFEEAVFVARRGIEHHSSSAELYAALAEALHAQGDNTAAAKAFGDAVELDPENIHLRLEHAHALIGIGDKAGATKELETAVAKGEADDMMLAAMLYELLHDPNGCIAAMNKAIAEKATYDAYEQRAECAMSAHRPDLVIHDLEAALRLKPDAPGHYMLARYAAQHNELQICHAHLTEAVKLVPGSKLADAAKQLMATACP